jgi:hypothetical protein
MKVILLIFQNALDKNGHTALDLCESNESPDWQAAANLLRFAMSHPVSYYSLETYLYYIHMLSVW